MDGTPAQPASTSAAGPKRRGKAIALLALKLAVSVGLLALLLSWIDVSEMARRFADPRWGWLILATVLLQFQAAISSLKWKVILAADDVRARYLFLFKTYLIAGFLSLFLPTAFGGDVYRTVALNRSGAKMSKSAASVLFDRFTGLFALLTIGLVGCMLLLDRSVALLIFLGYATGVAAFLIVTSDAAVRRLPNVSSKYMGFPFRIMRSFNAYRRRPKVLAAALGLSFCFQFNVVLIVTCYARTLRVDPIDVSFLELVAVVPLALLSEVLPSINGLGVREGAFVFFFKFVGGTAEQALAVSLMLIMLRYVQSLIGAALFTMSLLGYGKAGHSDDKAQRSPEPPSTESAAVPRPASAEATAPDTTAPDPAARGI